MLAILRYGMVRDDGEMVVLGYEDQMLDHHFVTMFCVEYWSRILVTVTIQNIHLSWNGERRHQLQLGCSAYLLGLHFDFMLFVPRTVTP